MAVDKAVNKVIYGGRVLVDLTADTVTASHLQRGYTAHAADGSAIVGTMDAGGGDSDEIDRILTAGLTDGYKQFSDDGTIISTTDSQGRTLTKAFSDNFLTCTTTLYDPNGVILGQIVKTFQEDSGTIVTTDSKGQTLVKAFSSDLKTMSAILTDSQDTEIARLTKTFSDDGRSITSVVEYA